MLAGLDDPDFQAFLVRLFGPEFFRDSKIKYVKRR